MTGSLNDILPEPISEENEKVLLEHLRRKMKSACGLSVRLLHAMEERFGPEARKVVGDMAENLKPTPRPDAGEPEADLHEFCAHLDKGCAGSHRWMRIVDEPGRIAYRFTCCMWAEIFREMGEPQIGFLLCAGDKPAVESYNPGLGFERTKTLMEGDEECDHVFYVRE